ncbi:vitamin K-dependent protein S [Octopus bimaculoides]|uniref:vitamin K-dependent protein S n=1 Tax=Octopus bimaculoides TaxID=37653 RepID=UPI0022E35184|nr:vitamin K-dependent protein S [Octopus bimaculoides]
MNSTGCFDTDECLKSSEICGNATCVNIDSSYKCVCDEGYFYNINTNSCTECPKNKYGKNCNETCDFRCASCDKITGCVCERGKKGNNCSEDINECNSTHECDRLTTTCENVVGSYYCKCKAGYKKILDIKCEGT